MMQDFSRWLGGLALAVVTQARQKSCGQGEIKGTRGKRGHGDEYKDTEHGKRDSEQGKLNFERGKRDIKNDQRDIDYGK